MQLQHTIGLSLASSDSEDEYSESELEFERVLDEWRRLSFFLRSDVEHSDRELELYSEDSDSESERELESSSELSSSRELERERRFLRAAA